LPRITAAYADDTAILTAHKDHVKASQRLQKSLFHTQIWLKKWRIRVNGAKSIQVTFTTRRKTCPPVILNGVSISQAESARYLELPLDRRLKKLEKTHIHQAKTTWNPTEQDVLDAR